ncbi:hypothetical protein AM202_02850 [Actinobacillus minor 202]|uniref:Uncharacterized protein n=2 Tax=Actinobacillus TaxID=713 RepID=A0A2U8FKX2_9PAST|nr:MULTISPECIES: hypothetical protein [Actinobacillus]AWI51629.1 hypothetical protein DDU33_09105 [Actinobacillus porcitonsillarum]EEV25126.1 hypothetical protein AM202_02850 [Actinobacillus minor 202]
MKKLVILSIGFITTAIASANEKQEIKLPFNGKPSVVLRVVDFSTKSPRVIDGKSVSISKKQQLCWSSVNVPVSSKVRIAEAFYTPAETDFSSPGMVINASDNKKEFLILGEVASVNNEYISRCWKFDTTDPIGTYHMEIQIGDFVFKNLSFNVIK